MLSGPTSALRAPSCLQRPGRAATRRRDGAPRSAWCGSRVVQTALVASLGQRAVSRSRTRRCRRAPDFERFCDHLLGTWRGWSSPWLSPDSLAKGSGHGSFRCPWTRDDTKVTPIARNCAACAGVVQGCRDRDRHLDRDGRGFVFFDCGSWTLEEPTEVVTALQRRSQRQVLSCRFTSSGEVSELQWTLQEQLDEFRRGAPLDEMAPEPPAEVLQGTRRWLQEISSWKGSALQSTASGRSAVFVSTRLAWRSTASEELMKLWRGALEFDFPTAFLAVKHFADPSAGFWLLAGDVQSSTAKIIGRKYLLPDATRPDGPTLVSVALLDLSPEEQESKSAEGQRMMDRG
ncbi:unnamed protein product [Durusdinium trenchii]|uniref:Uncharacterized protein n=1 Tax=Durusdinium trenchii TaxID=1381693 RepID=A0ABP0RLS1_9DINO